MENSILFGNGINRLNASNISWEDVLNDIKGPRKFAHNLLPYTMVYERVILETPNLHKDILLDEFEVKTKIAETLKRIGQNTLYSELFDLNIQNYLSTNYDYSFINSIIDRDDINTPIHEYGTEDVYSLRRLKRISNVYEKKKHLWQIHGEISKPATIMLGLDHYCGSIGKIDNYIKGRYSYVKDKHEIKELSIAEKFENNEFNGSSWVELFFTSNIHILGFTLDYVEIDLWWILNKRARMKKSFLKEFINNQITVYVSSMDQQKIGLLKSMSVNVEMINVSKGEKKYNEYYERLIKKLKRL
ncbi:hypothetical protein MG296_00740 [Flavobacteriaceae bacterium TK19130]|nr:hypothetical protein [Thermobacterium salinum]